jgi:hypothetical protein
MVAHARLVPWNIDSWCIYRTLYADQTISEVLRSRRSAVIPLDGKLFLANKHLPIQKKFCERIRHTQVAFDHDGCARDHRKRIEGLHRTDQIVQVDSTSQNKHLL